VNRTSILPHHQLASLYLLLLLPFYSALCQAAPQTFELEDGRSLELKVGKTVSASPGTSSLDTALKLTTYELRLLNAEGKLEASVTYNDYSKSPMQILQAEMLSDELLVIVANVGKTLNLISFQKQDEGWHELQSDRLVALPEEPGKPLDERFSNLSFEWSDASEKVITKDAEGKVLEPLGIIDLIKF